MNSEEIKKFIIKCLNQINDNLFFNLNHIEDKHEKETIANGMGTINKCQDEICKEELTAQEMFEKLGYKHNKQKEKEVFIKGGNLYDERIGFYYEGKTIEKTQGDELDSMLDFPSEISIQELKAINQKCKELGWL